MAVTIIRKECFEVFYKGSKETLVCEHNASTKTVRLKLGKVEEDYFNIPLGDERFFPHTLLGSKNDFRVSVNYDLI